MGRGVEELEAGAIKTVIIHGRYREILMTLCSKFPFTILILDFTTFYTDNEVTFNESIIFLGL